MDIQEKLKQLMAVKAPQVRWAPIDEVKENPKNPRTISDIDMNNLKNSITEFPEMLVLRPGIVDENMILLGGNQRRRACKELGWPMFPVIDAHNLSEEQVKELIIKDNLPFGKWNVKDLKAEWDVAKLAHWGMNVKDLIDKASTQGEMKFATEIDFESNFVVLTFKKDIDWLHVLTVLGLEPVYSKRSTGKPWSRGTGRVVDGITAIEKLKKIDLV